MHKWLSLSLALSLSVAACKAASPSVSTRTSASPEPVVSVTVSATTTTSAPLSLTATPRARTTGQAQPIATETAQPTTAFALTHLDLSIVQTVTVQVDGSSGAVAWGDAYGLVLVKGRDDLWVQTSDGQRLALTDLVDLSSLERRDFLAIATDGRSLVVHGRRVDQLPGFQFHLPDRADDVSVADRLSPCGYFGWVKPGVLVCGEYVDSTSNTVTLKSYYDPRDEVIHSIPDIVAYNGTFAVSPDRSQILILPEAASGMLLVDTRTGLTTTVLPWVVPFESQLSENIALEWNSSGVTLATTQANGLIVIGPLRLEDFQEADPPRRIVSFPAAMAEWTNTEIFWHDEGLRHIGVLRAVPNDTAGDDQPRYLIDHWLIDTESGEAIAYQMPERVVIGTVRASPDDRYWAWEAQDVRAHWVLLLDRETGRMARFDDGTDVEGWWVLPR